MKSIKQKLIFYIHALQKIDLQDYAHWPRLLKFCYLIVLFTVVLALAYGLFVYPKVVEIEQARIHQQKLLNTYRSRYYRLMRARYEQQNMQQLRAYFSKQLQLLVRPEQLPELIATLHQSARVSGLKIKNIQLETTVQQDFLLIQPILIEAQGDYHALGHFVSEIAKLPQLISLHDFSIELESEANQHSAATLLKYQLQIKTYHQAHL
ncbi:type 4a pilus biogenesis protein PilO [Acinetobacter rudis]|uniref:type 4a pilus biogenesis protein PilO n=1 Tax=Acinetobacter rudis TaxID=632955 RepID=UPI00280E2B94|nr:type 4a pilus biogenesis protein PilO [Acinetobacter rudis]MDQ8953057.1 type 4a pilus biogenesis protein PilO [Acinetobacter rudis]